MRILITEEALEAGAGHWPSYIGDLASEFRAAGDEVTVLTHREATPEVLERVGGTPWYSRNCWRDPRSQGKLGGLLHNRNFHRETLTHLRATEPYDRILALTMRMQHLLAFSALANDRRIPADTRFVLLFVQGFGRHVAAGAPTAFPSGFSTRLARLAFRRMAGQVRAGRVVLAGETAGMCDELRRFTGLPATLFPHPVHLPETAAAGAGSAAAEDVLTVSCPGYARHEKGSDLLHDAILRILDGPHGDRYRFVLQWPEPFGMPGGGTMSPDPRLVADPRVEFVNENLNPAQYAALLDRSDLVILPYRSHSYHQRLSRVAIEAAGKGIPLIYTAHTWTCEVAELVGTGVRIESETVDEVVKALEQARENAGKLQAEAKRRARDVLEFHSAATFRRRLLAP